MCKRLSISRRGCVLNRIKGVCGIKIFVYLLSNWSRVARVFIYKHSTGMFSVLEQLISLKLRMRVDK